MDYLFVHFPVSGVETWIFIPLVTAFAISFFTSMGGISGAFLLLPFQVSFLNYVSPSVSGTNQLYNVVGIPASVWRYIKEGRMIWPLAWIIIAGTIPGVGLGAWIRIHWLTDPGNFKRFAGIVLLYIGLKMARELAFSSRSGTRSQAGQGQSQDFMVTKVSFSARTLVFHFNGDLHQVSVPLIFLLCLGVGLVGGTYGIGGGAIVAPFLVTFARLPVHSIAGAALMGTFASSVIGVAFYHVMAHLYPGTQASPDWPLGILFGLGGAMGMYLGARCQKHVSPFAIKLILCTSLFCVGARYLLIS